MIQTEENNYFSFICEFERFLLSSKQVSKQAQLQVVLNGLLHNNNAITVLHYSVPTNQ